MMIDEITKLRAAGHRVDVPLEQAKVALLAAHWDSAAFYPRVFQLLGKLWCVSSVADVEELNDQINHALRAELLVPPATLQEHLQAVRELLAHPGD